MSFSEVGGTGPLQTNIAITAIGASKSAPEHIGDLDGWAGNAHASQSPPRHGVEFAGLVFVAVSDFVLEAHLVHPGRPGHWTPYQRLHCNKQLMPGVQVTCESLVAGSDPAIRTLEIVEMR
ncbi:hypothetical protein [Stenotrophomonas forensis]|uniref:hypothetical protein n=1 Tax=Stenotrophomonas forensis TaxID=2871169 RepID=UPI0039C6DCBD